MPSQVHLNHLISRLEAVRRDMVSLEESSGPLISSVQERHRRSATNLIHYTALRRHDLRETQRDLAKVGLSSLGRCERWALGNVDAVIKALYALSGSSEPDPGRGTRLTMDQGRELIESNARDLLGMAPERIVRVMVTMPTEAADDYGMMRDLVNAGMNLIRINCAHDDESVWGRMIENRNRACRELNRECAVYMDLAGPNPRTRVPEGVYKGVRLHKGDRLTLVREMPEDPSPDIPTISCSYPSVVDDLKTGDRVLVDDGTVHTVVEEKGDGRAVLRVTMAAGEKGKKLKTEKGINLPDTALRIPSLTGDDLAALPFIAEHADVVGYSFVRSVEDVVRLQEELARQGGRNPGIVLKIETVPAFRNLPHLLLAAMKSPQVGVMIARGDLAVEAGFERLSEVQEEILWFCEAAHIPVIWATQVLETYVKTGVPGRGEITDAAMSGRAECVMLNKGLHVVEAVDILDDILMRMRSHQDKKRSIFRPLSVSTFFDGQELVPSI